MHVLISKKQELEKMMAQIKGSRALAIDTEFLREKTYYPILCLIQMATDDCEFIIDPLSIGDLSSIADILVDSQTVKIFHAGSQDRELLYLRCGVISQPVFDTQAAAPYIGMPQQVGYATMVSELFGVQLKKSESLTDWSYRPLAANQIKYALEDVRYLIPAYDKMVSQLKENGRLKWLESDLEEMASLEQYKKSEDDLWKKVKKANSLSRKQLVHVSNLAIWREKIAQKRDIPRKKVLQDELIIEIARLQPTSVGALYKIRGTQDKLNQKMAEDIIYLVEKGKKAPPETWPVKDRKKHQVVGADALVDVLMGIIRTRARQNNLAPQILACHSDLVSLANGKRDDQDLLKGWRYDLVGRELLDFLDGKLSLSIEDGLLVIDSMDEQK